jgi:hypothetical protein
VKIRRCTGLAVLAALTVLLFAGCSSTGPDVHQTGSISDPEPSDRPAENLDAGTLAYLKANADALARQLKISNPPSVAPVRLISLADYASTQIACLNHAGFTAKETADGEGISYPPVTDPGLKATLNLAIYTCELQYPTQEKYMTPLSTKGLQALYDYRAGPLIECLKKQGYTVTDRVPSRAVFVQSNGSWSPYASLSIRDRDLKKVFATCPQTPDSVYGHLSK